MEHYVLRLVEESINWIFKKNHYYSYTFDIWYPTLWKVSKYGVISGPYFPVFGLDSLVSLMKMETETVIDRVSQVDIEKILAVSSATSLVLKSAIFV